MRINGTAGADTIFGINEEADVIRGFAGDDLLNGGFSLANDSLYGGLGNDTLRGGPGNDLLVGDGGNDFLDDQEGTNRLLGGNGNDHLDGNGYLSGGAGNDVLSPFAFTQPIVSELDGGLGADTFDLIFRWYSGASIVIDDFKPGQADKLDVFEINTLAGERRGQALFQALDTDHNGQLLGNGSDQLVHSSDGALVIDFDVGNHLTLKGVDHLNASDWLV